MCLNVSNQTRLPPPLFPSLPDLCCKTRQNAARTKWTPVPATRSERRAGSETGSRDRPLLSSRTRAGPGVVVSEGGKGTRRSARTGKVNNSGGGGGGGDDEGDDDDDNKYEDDGDDKDNDDEDEDNDTEDNDDEGNDEDDGDDEDNDDEDEEDNDDADGSTPAVRPKATVRELAHTLDPRLFAFKPGDSCDIEGCGVWSEDHVHRAPGCDCEM